MLKVSAAGGRGASGAGDGETANPLEELSLEQLRGRGSMKWRTHPADVLPLWVAEMDVLLAPAVADALREAIETGDTGYPAGTEFAESLAGFASRRWKWDGIAVDRVALIPDVMMGAVQVLRLITDPGDPVVVNSPVYAPFYAFVTHDDRRIIEAPLGQDLRISLETLEETFRRAREQSGKGRIAYLLSNPHNPTGAVHTFDELVAVAQLARRYGVRVVADEIHAPLVLPGAQFTPYLSVPGAEDAFSLMSATKGWNLAGIKAALAVAGPEAAADLRRMPEEVHHGASHLGVIAHTAASVTGTAGSTRCSRDSTPTAPCWVSSSPSTCPGSDTPGRREPTWPGSTAGPSASRRKRGPRAPRWSPTWPAPHSCSWSTQGWPCPPATSSEREEPGTSA
jgi:cystathionine beta-lyase